MTNLKPCPFCDGAAVISFRKSYCANGNDLCNQVIVACIKCDAVMEGDDQYNNRFFDKKAIQEVTEAWNTRVGDMDGSK